MADLSVTGEVVVTSEKAEAAFDRVGDKATQMANEVTTSAGKAGQAVDGIGAGAEKSADKFTRAESLMRAAIMKSTRELELLGKTASQRFEAQIDFKGLEKAKFQEAISGLQAMESALSVAKAREAEFAAQNGFSLKAAQAKELVKASEYAGWWAQELEKVEAAEKRLAGQNSFINSLKSQADAIGKTKADLLEMQAAQMGVATQAAPFIARMREAEASVGKMGVSAAQTAAALRGVPAQFTDIVTSLQGGQAPLTVLLQQGGQLKDMFGGAGNAARALGGYVLGLVNPFTIAAAAVAGIAVAYNQGRKEAEAFNKTLILSGNAAGTSADNLSDMARAIDATSSGITQSKAAEVLNSIAASGDVAADKLQRYAQTAIEFERAGGGAVEEVAKAFSSLAGDPLAAVEKLNKSTNFLTAEIYNQIKALEDEGRSTDAARVAQDAYTSMLDQRIPKLKDNLGLLERGWMGVKDAAAEAWDSMLNVGRAQTLGSRLQAAEKLLADYENTLPGKRTTEQVAGVQAAGGVDGLRNQIAGLRELMETQRKADEQQRANNQSTQAAINLSKQASQFDTDLEKQRKAVAQATDLYTKALAAGNLSESARAQLEKDYLKTVTGITAAKEQRSTSTRKENKDLADQSRIFAELADVSSTYYADLATAQQQRAKGNLSEAQYVKYVEELIQKQPFAVAAAKARAEAIKEEAKAAAESSKALSAWAEVRAKESQGLQNQINARREEVSMMGMTTEAVIEYTRAKFEQQAAEKEAYAAALESASFYAGEYAEAYKTAAEAARQQAKQLRELGGLEVEKANKEAAKKAADEWERAADDINRSLTDALMRGFESGKDFAKNMRDTVTNMFKTLVLRPTISAVMSPVAGAINGMLYGNAAAAAGGGANALGMLGSGANLINGLQGTQGMLGTVGGWLGLNTVAANTGLAATIGIDAASAAAAANAAGAAGGGLLSGVGAALPWIGGIAALASILGGLDDSGTYHTGGAAQYSAATGLRTSLGFRDNEEGLPSYNPNDNIDNQFGTGFGYVERGDQTITAVSAIAQGIATALDSVALAFGRTAGYEVAAAFARDTSEDPEWAALRISQGGRDLTNLNDDRASKWAPREVADGDAGWQQFLGIAAQEMRDIVLGMDLSTWAEDMVKSLGDAPSIDQLGTVLAQIAQVQTVFVALGNSMEMFANLSGEMQSGLLAAAGSIDALTAGAGAFYQGFYTEQERMDSAVAQINKTLTGLDLSIDPTLGDDAKDQFRAAVEAAFAAGDADLAAGLLAISGNFASAADYFEQLSQSAAQAAAQAAEQAAQMAERQAAEQASIAGDLRRQILELTGDTTAIRQLEIAGMNAANVALYDRVQALQAEAEQTAIRADLERQVLELTGDTAAIRQLEIAGMDAVNVALYDRIQALQSEAQASEQAAQAAAEQAAIGESLQRQIIQLTGDSAAIRQLEIAGMDAANIALYDRVQALQAEQAAAEKAKQVAQERYGIETSMLQLQGNTAALRARELALLDPANRADQLRLYILQDAQEAAKAAADAERDLAASRVQSAQDAYRAAQDATGGAFDALSRSVNAERSLYESARAAAADAAQEIKAVIDTLDGSIQDLYAGVDSSRQASAVEGSAFIARALQAARTTGYLPDAKALSDAITQARDGLGSQNYATQFEADRAQLIMAGQLSELSDIAKPQLTAAERTLRNAEDQLKALDDILKNAQAQVDAVRGISTTVGTISDALFGLQAALLSEAQAKALAQSTTAPPATAPTTPTTTTGGALSGPYASQIADAIKAAAYTTDDRLVYDTARMLGVTSSELDKLMGWKAGTSLDWARRNNLPAFAVGTNYVPRDMLATIHEGEAIVPKAFNPWAAGGQGMGGGNAEVVAELRALRQQNERLESRLASIEGSNNTMVSLLDDVTDGGNAMRSEVMA